MMSRARSAEKYYSISPSYYEAIVKLGCFYCGTELSNKNNMNIDRVDNSGHYTVENIVPCCKNCNFAKRFMGASEFLSWVKSVARKADEVENKLKTLKDNVDDWRWDKFDKVEHNMKVLIDSN